MTGPTVDEWSTTNDSTTNDMYRTTLTSHSSLQYANANSVLHTPGHQRRFR